MRIGFLSYLGAQGKRALRLLPLIAAFGVLLLAAVSAFTFFTQRAKENDPASARLRIGLAGEEGNVYMTLAEMALQNDALLSSAQILRVSEEEAIPLLRDGELSACIVLPEGFFDAIGVGEHKTIRYITSPFEAGVGQTLMRDVVSSVSKILLACENSIYGVQQFIFENDLPKDPVDEANALISRYFSKALDRDDLFEIVETKETGGLSSKGYALVAQAVFFFMLWGCAAAPLYAFDRAAMKKLLVFSGLGTLRQALALWLVHCAVCLVGLLPAFAGALTLTRVFYRAELPSFFASPVTAVLRILVVCILFSTLSCLFYALSSGGAGALLLHVFFALTVGYFSGCFYPISFFEPAVRRVFSLLPGAVALRFIASFDTGDLRLLILYTGVFAACYLAASCAARKRRAA